MIFGLVFWYLQNNLSVHLNDFLLQREREREFFSTKDFGPKKMPFQFLYSCAVNNSVHTHLLRRGKYHCRMDSTISLHTNNNKLTVVH